MTWRFSKTWLYHVSPAQNRESILQHGLKGGSGEHASIWDTKRQEWAQAVDQPKGNYFFTDPASAHEYVHGLHSAIHGQHENPDDWFDERMIPEDTPDDFHKWNEDDQDEWHDNQEYRDFDHTKDLRNLPRDNSGYDVWKVDGTNVGLHQDPELALTDGEWSEEDALKHEPDEWGDDSPQAARWMTQDHIAPQQMQHHQYVPPWEMTADNAEDLYDAGDNEYNIPHPYDKVPLSVTPRPPAAFSSVQADQTPQSPAEELRAWLQGFSQPLSPHHEDETDFMTRTASSSPNKFITTLEGHKERKAAWELRHEPLRRHAMAADPAWWEEFQKQHPYLYHATQGDAAESILDEGLYPFDHEYNPRGSEWEDDHLRPRSGHTYLATADRIEDIADGQNKHHVLRVATKDLDPALINSDEDAYAGGAYPRHEGVTVQRPTHDFETKRVYASIDDEEAARKKFRELQEQHTPAYPETYRRNSIARDDLHKWLDDKQHEHGIQSWPDFGRWANDVELNHPDHVKHSLGSHQTMAYNGAIPPHHLEEDEGFSMDREECPSCGDAFNGEECNNCGWSQESSCPHCQVGSITEHNLGHCDNCSHQDDEYAPGSSHYVQGQHALMAHSEMDNNGQVQTPWMSINGNAPQKVHPNFIEPNDTDNLPAWTHPSHPDYPLNGWAPPNLDPQKEKLFNDLGPIDHSKEQFTPFGMQQQWDFGK